ncbi:O-antigen polysaccharide polymerase Wzy [Collimonas pratensis]|uniref:O-antigen polysaccharide polymerase Wzy family protein n=1 Tax=Collimonas pratensis TaxID=279113 RepID=A0A127PZX6_9BURK|nr:O-antigen polysaccharide polymerase Wzy [Collimonas pratensis]AMP03327.1 O-antigen polysaccharide polymerase Wzy family protein [Collimonas pratensis]
MLDRRDLIIAIAWVLGVLFAVLVDQFSPFDVETASVLLSVGTILLTAANWRAHQGGRNASFIFLVLACIFLCGRAFPALLGGESLLDQIGFTDGYSVTPETVMAYVVLALTSFFFIHIGSLLPRATIRALGNSHVEAKIYWRLFLLFLPALIYKNIYYFTYIISHGGYLAIYQGSDHLEGVGILARIGSLLCLASFTLYFFHETDQKKSGRALIFFLIVFASELLVGLRGKFFVTALVFFLFHKLRFGGKFSLRGLAVLLSTIIVIAIAVEVMREQKTESNIHGAIFMGFLVQQGVSAGVNLVVLSDPSYYIQHAWGYFWHQFAAPFYSQPEVPQGWFLANDISLMIMPEAFAAGYGTGSSYLAELFLLGGAVAVCIGSVAIGWLLGMAKRFNQGVAGAIMFWVVCGVVYYPRTMLQEPVHNLMRYAAPIVLLAICCHFLRVWRRKKST